MQATTMTRPAAARRTTAGRSLLGVIAEANMVGVDRVAAAIRSQDLRGERDSADASPAGLWVLHRMRELGEDARSYRWGLDGEFAVRDSAGRVTARSRVTRGALYDLECLINDLDERYVDLVA